MKKFPFYFLVLYLLASCQGTKQAETQALSVVDMTKSYPEKEIVLQDIADVEYIPLETTDDFLFNGVAAIVSDKYIVTIGHQSEDVCLFSREGKALTRIHRVGNGPGEYKDIATIDVNWENGELYLKEMNRQKIHVYSLDGTFKRSLPYPENIWLNQMYLFSPEYLIACRDFTPSAGSDAGFHPYLLVSTESGQLDSLSYVQKKCVQVKLIINEQAHLYGYMHEPSIICNGSRFYIGNADSDTLFTMESDFALKPLLVRTPSHNEEGNQYGLFLKGVAGPYLFLTKQPMEIPMNSIDHLDLQNEEWLYDRRTQEVVRYIFKNREDTSKPVSGIMFYRYPEDCALVILKSEDLVEAYEAGELSGELKKIVSGMKVDDNPVLMLIQFKG
ncbi:6-bladed beta-propeller [Bacteroides fragilis]|uniref:6-bladed beta-propeller n=1 Tax=Bacteroides fragilis TaxID=817 RepID=UPI0028116C62|nr:6-bladed beta-propeller [Bacteroides fragilis]WMI92980.1 6-bladed beta-propeller [Bacteroides fragilis]